MATPRFLDVFSQVIVEDELTNNFQNAILSECKLDIDERTLDIKIKSDDYITHENQIKLNVALKNSLQLNSCSVKFDFTNFTAKACKDIAEELKTLSILFGRHEEPVLETPEATDDTEVTDTKETNQKEVAENA